MSDHWHANRPARTRTELPATLTDSNGTVFQVSIIDLSADGFRLRSAEGLDEGEIVSLKSGRNEPQLARILWAGDDQAGGVFLYPPELES